MTAIRALLLVVLSTLSLSAYATMELSNVIFHFEPGEDARQDFEIFNPADEPLYVQIEPTQVLSPGETAEDRAPITDPRQAGLLVTPNKLIIPPGESKLVRMVKLANSPTEKVYRIGAKPIVSGLEAEQSGVKILIGYEVLAIVYPNNVKPELVVEREGRQMTVRNEGNTNVLMREGFQCVTPDTPKEDCTPVAGRRMYPGNVWEIELPEDLPVTFYHTIGNRSFAETYP